ncbi:hypothetical protein L198_02390 [Cryptococcus wingfieldii CBS 7118]|uniref:Uncharacterized protein n=1 Tax=Cryptococcus wingfieldii CBS 7118 TaxID=1295528 RepID=A0A1E3JUE4_9TREE|nr:hypothetical protein L198_02390 [Cryptococcus wingfieldii CBS 7118]ODO03542.1 hypothetical protein L198_02390 [Cryptococcus wingfieldii CBS 7118]
MPSRTDGESAEESDLDSDYQLSLGRERYLESIHVAPSPESSSSTTPSFLSCPCDSIPLQLHTPTCPYPDFQNPLAMNASRLETSTPTRQQASRARPLNEPVVSPLAYEMSMIGEKGVHLDTDDGGGGEHTPHEYQEDGAEVVSAA